MNDDSEILSRLDRIIELMEEQCLAPAEYTTPALDPAFAVGQALEIPELPVGTYVRDVDGDVWLHQPEGWAMRRSGGYDTWNEVIHFAPLTVVAGWDS